MDNMDRSSAQLRALADSDRRADAQALIDAFHLNAGQKRQLADVLGDPARLKALLQSAQAKKLQQQMESQKPQD